MHSMKFLRVSIAILILTIVLCKHSVKAVFSLKLLNMSCLADPSYIVFDCNLTDHIMITIDIQLRSPLCKPRWEFEVVRVSPKSKEIIFKNNFHLCDLFRLAGKASHPGMIYLASIVAKFTNVTLRCPFRPAAYIVRNIRADHKSIPVGLFYKPDAFVIFSQHFYTDVAKDVYQEIGNITVYGKAYRSVRVKKRPSNKKNVTKIA